MNQIIESTHANVRRKNGTKLPVQATDREIIEYMHDLTTHLMLMGARFDLIYYFLSMARMEMAEVLTGTRKPRTAVGARKPKI